MNKVNIIVIKVTDRIKESLRTQEVLSKYSELIRTRIGFHELNEAVCSRIGYILLETEGDHQLVAGFENELDQIGGIKVRKMVFDLDSEEKYSVEIQKDDPDSILIIGIMISNKSEEIIKLQKIFTNYGCSIKLRIGINRKGSGKGLIIMELTGDVEQSFLLQKEILEQTNAKLKKIVLN